MHFAGCSADDLCRLAEALRDGRLSSPYSTLALAKLSLPAPNVLAADLASLTAQGLSGAGLVALVAAIGEERQLARAGAPSLELVATGPDPSERARDTAVVVEQLFAEAKHSVLMAGFALYKGREIFRRLAERMDTDPMLETTLCLDISRPGSDTTRDSDIVARFADNFIEKHWPGIRLPLVYYDPRGLSSDRLARAVLHAKTIVIDQRTALLTSANPTPAAYLRNIELGILVSNCGVPAAIHDHFDGLIKSGALHRLALPDRT